MADNNKSTGEKEEKTVLLDDDSKTVLLDDDSKTVLLDGDADKTVHPEEEEKTVFLDDEQVTEASEQLKSKSETPKEKAADTVAGNSGVTETVKISNTDLCPCCMEKKPAGSSVCPKCGMDSSKYEAKIHHLPPGSLLYNRYLIGRVIGEGGFGITYIGFDKKLDIRVAVKEYFPSGMVMRDTTGSRGNTVTAYSGKNRELYEKYLSRFYNEAKTLAKLQSIEGVVHVQDYFSENDTAYIIMEYVDGRDLKVYAKEKGGKLDCDEALGLFKPVAEALSKLHKNGVIHRDISPDNIMVTKEGKVVLIDLGASREFGDNQKSMSVLLKPGYAPIEQYQSSEKQGAYTDIYSFCASFYRVITGKTPTDAMERLGNAELKTPSQLGVKIDPNIENALMKGLAVHHSDRFQSMDELIEVFYKGKSYGKQEPAFKTPAPKAKAGKPEGDAVTGAPDIEDVKGGAETAGTTGAKKSKLPIIIISGAVLAGLVTFLIIFLNMANQKDSDVKPADPDTSTSEGGVTDPTDPSSDVETDPKDTSSSGTTDPSESTEPTEPENVTEVKPIFQRSATVEPATIMYYDGSFTQEGETDSIEFTPPRDGRYRVEAVNMPSSMSVDLGFYDSKGVAVEENTECRNGQGVTVKQVKGDQTYTVELKQNTGTGNYRVSIGVQKSTPDITDLTRIDDSVEYTDQRNLYNFVVPRDGWYRFELSGLDSGVDTIMHIWDDPGNKISEKNGVRNGDGLTLNDVKAGDIYEIQVRQSNGYSDYSLKIGQQKETVNIANKSVVHDSIEYTDQHNIYSFNASSSGSVKFTLSDMSPDMAVELIVKDSNGNTVASQANCKNDGGISIKNVASGMHYYVQVVQSSGTGDYTLKVE